MHKTFEKVKYHRPIDNKNTYTEDKDLLNSNLQFSSELFA